MTSADSSTNFNNKAFLSIDGNMSTSFLAHSQKKLKDWWQVELDEKSHVHQVTFFIGRIDDKEYSLNKNAEIQVRVGFTKYTNESFWGNEAVDNNVLCRNYKGPVTPGKMVTVHCYNIQPGKYVSLEERVEDTGDLNLAEVKIYGEIGTIQ